MLEPERLHDRRHPFREAASLAVAAEAFFRHSIPPRTIRSA
jgi:hypothetical protein